MLTESSFEETTRLGRRRRRGWVLVARGHVSEGFSVTRGVVCWAGGTWICEAVGALVARMEYVRCMVNRGAVLVCCGGVRV